jgi:hypothetical protein
MADKGLSVVDTWDLSEVLAAFRQIARDASNSEKRVVMDAEADRWMDSILPREAQP